MRTVNTNILPSLIRNKNAVYMDQIPQYFQKDILQFISGETLNGCENGRIRIPEKLYKRWLKKIWLKGFDYDIPLQVK